MDKSDLPTVAAFDFDGTISYHDTLIHFLFFAAGFWRCLWGLLMTSPWLLGRLFGVVSRHDTKQRVFLQLFAGLELSVLEEKARIFVKRKLPKLLRPNALEKIQWHRDQCHRLVLVSASPELYLLYWADRAGFNDVLATRLEVNAGKVTGRILGLNCRGPEKVRRLNELLGDRDQYELYAYGDSAGDRELLAYADHPHLHAF